MHARGFTLVEVLVSLAIVLLAALATAQTLALAATAVHDARVHTVTAAAAAQRLEQLLAAEWAALTPSPANALDDDIGGYVDFLDADGNVVGVGAAPPPGAAFVRRWAIGPPATGTANALVIRVLARSLAADRAGARGARGEARLVTVRARDVE